MDLDNDLDTVLRGKNPDYICQWLQKFSECCRSDNFSNTSVMESVISATIPTILKYMKIKRQQLLTALLKKSIDHTARAQGYPKVLNLSKALIVFPGQVIDAMLVAIECADHLLEKASSQVTCPIILKQLSRSMRYGHIFISLMHFSLLPRDLAEGHADELNQNLSEHKRIDWNIILLPLAISNLLASTRTFASNLLTKHHRVRVDDYTEIEVLLLDWLERRVSSTRFPLVVDENLPATIVKGSDELQLYQKNEDEMIAIIFEKMSMLSEEGTEEGIRQQQDFDNGLLQRNKQLTPQVNNMSGEEFLERLDKLQQIVRDSYLVSTSRDSLAFMACISFCDITVEFCAALRERFSFQSLRFSVPNEGLPSPLADTLKPPEVDSRLKLSPNPTPLSSQTSIKQLCDQEALMGIRHPVIGMQGTTDPGRGSQSVQQPILIRKGKSRMERRVLHDGITGKNSDIRIYSPTPTPDDIGIPNIYEEPKQLSMSTITNEKTSSLINPFICISNIQSNPSPPGIRTPLNNLINPGFRTNLLVVDPSRTSQRNTLCAQSFPDCRKFQDEIQRGSRSADLKCFFENCRMALNQTPSVGQGQEHYVEKVFQLSSPGGWDAYSRSIAIHRAFSIVLQRHNQEFLSPIPICDTVAASLLRNTVAFYENIISEGSTLLQQAREYNVALAGDVAMQRQHNNLRRKCLENLEDTLTYGRQGNTCGKNSDLVDFEYKSKRNCENSHSLLVHNIHHKLLTLEASWRENKGIEDSKRLLPTPSSSYLRPCTEETYKQTPQQRSVLRDITNDLSEKTFSGNIYRNYSRNHCTSNGQQHPHTYVGVSNHPPKRPSGISAATPLATVNGGNASSPLSPLICSVADYSHQIHLNDIRDGIESPVFR